MYCVIQKIKNKKSNPYGERKEIKVSSTTWSMGNEPPKTKYHYKYSDERFERPILDAYKISIHESYREKGAVKKKQWVICTMGYYTFMESWAGDCIVHRELELKLIEMNITEDKLWDMVYEKLTPIQESILKEFEESKESKAKKKHSKILKEYQKVKKTFEDKYGQDTYDYCYDVFGNIQNKDYLAKVKADYKAQQQYKSSYHDNSYSNYSQNDYSQYFSNSTALNFKDSEKIIVQELIQAGYKALAKKYHPDLGGTKEQFQELGAIKDKLLKTV